MAATERNKDIFQIQLQTTGKDELNRQREFVTELSEANEKQKTT